MADAEPLRGARPGALARVAPEKTLLLSSSRGLRYVRLSPLSQTLMAAGVALAFAWGAVAAGALAARGISDAGEADALAAVATAYENRLETAAAAAAAQNARLETLRAEREALAARLGEADARADAAEAGLAAAAQEREELSLTLTRVADALEAAAAQRDHALAAASGFEAERERQTQLLARVGEAAELTIAPLENLLSSAGVDVDAVLEEVRREAGGVGGPFVPLEPATATATATATAASGAARPLTVMSSLERVNLLRLAAQRLPFATPVEDARLTSRFGPRRDPINGRGARHEGLDLVAPRGAPVLASAAGRVVHAGWMRGFGRAVKVRHDFGFETLYAHMDETRVQVGERVEAGTRVGDLGNTGRSTGPHLHYEIRVEGRPVDPHSFIKAARDVL
jgi:murein DD-endopeptidase MepM/ murein hydrolase activator NlpD